MMKQFFNRVVHAKYALPAALALLGAIGGYCYYRFVGCATGTCAIASNPYISTIYGGVIGALLGSAFAPKKQSGGEN